MKWLALFLLTFAAAQARSQNPQNLFLEVGKTGLILNLGYDKTFREQKLGYRVSAGSNFGRWQTLYSVLGGGYYLVGGSRKALELGADIQYILVQEVSDDQISIPVYPSGDFSGLVPSANVGYRSSGKNVLFRIGLSPIYIESRLTLGAYITLGIRLK